LKIKNQRIKKLFQTIKESKI